MLIDVLRSAWLCMPKEGTALGVHFEHKGCSAEQIPAVSVLGLLALTLLCIITGNQPAGRHWQEGGGGRREKLPGAFLTFFSNCQSQTSGLWLGSYLPPPPITGSSICSSRRGLGMTSCCGWSRFINVPCWAPCHTVPCGSSRTKCPRFYYLGPDYSVRI